MKLIVVILLSLYGLVGFAQQDSAARTNNPPLPVEQIPNDKREFDDKPGDPAIQKTGPTIPKKDSIKQVTPLKRKFDWSKVYTGGDLGLSFGTVVAVNLSPIIGYKITPKFSAGIGITYIYYSVPKYGYKQSIYGGSIFSRYQLFDFLFAHVEYQALNGLWDTYFNRRYFINNFWVGGGLSQPIGGNSTVSIMVLWNLNESSVSYPSSPWIRMGVNIGL